MISPLSELNRNVPPSTASVDADAEPTTASMPAMAKTENDLIERMDSTPVITALPSARST